MGYSLRARGYLTGFGVITVDDFVLRNADTWVQTGPFKDSVATAAAVSQQAWAVYLGPSGIRIASGTTLKFKYQINGAFSGVTWGEAAIATGAYAGRATNPTLTVRAYGDIAGDIIGTGASEKTLSALTSDIAAGTGLWGILAVNATGLGTYRGFAGGNVHGLAATRNSTQPSTAIGTAQAYTVRNGGTVEPLILIGNA